MNKNTQVKTENYWLGSTETKIHMGNATDLQLMRMTDNISALFSTILFHLLWSTIIPSILVATRSFLINLLNGGICCNLRFFCHSLARKWICKEILRSMNFYCCCMHRNRLSNSLTIHGKAETMHCSHLIQYVHEKSRSGYPNAFQQNNPRKEGFHNI